MKFPLFSLVALCVVCSSALAGEVVLLKSDKVTVTQKDVERYIAFRVPTERQEEFFSSEERIKQAIQNIYMIRDIALLAKDVDEEQLQWQLAFQRDSWLAEIAQEQVVDAAFANVNWENMAREAYLAEPERYKTRNRVDAAHILIRTESRSLLEAREIAGKIRQRALAGENFNVLAKEFSEDKSVETNNGELGVFSAERMVKPFSDAVFAMKKEGSISDLVETQFGVHIIKLNKVLPGELRPFEKVKGQIVKTVQTDMRVKQRERLLIEARGGEGAILNNEAIEKMVKQATSNQP